MTSRIERTKDGGYTAILDRRDNPHSEETRWVARDVTDAVEAIVAERLAERTSALHAAVMQHTATAEAQQARIATLEGRVRALLDIGHHWRSQHRGSEHGAIDATRAFCVAEARIQAVRDVCERLLDLRVLSMVTPATEVLAALDGTTPQTTPESTPVTCECYITTESMWTRAGSCVESGSTRKYNPQCPEHRETQTGAQDGGQA